MPTPYPLDETDLYAIDADELASTVHERLELDACDLLGRGFGYAYPVPLPVDRPSPLEREVKAAVIFAQTGFYDCNVAGVGTLCGQVTQRDAAFVRRTFLSSTSLFRGFCFELYNPTALEVVERAICRRLDLLDGGAGEVVVA